MCTSYGAVGARAVFALLLGVIGITSVARGSELVVRSVNRNGLLIVSNAPDRTSDSTAPAASTARDRAVVSLSGLKIYEADGATFLLGRAGALSFAAQRFSRFRWDTRFDAAIEQAARRTGVDTLLIKAVIKAESGFNPSAHSSAGAIGLMQLLPATARRYGVFDLSNPEQNIHAGASYLADLLRMFGGDVNLALAGYNAGEYAVVRHGYRIPPYRETVAYVPRVRSIWRSLRERDPER